MHIKSVSISGFRSYREETVIDNFSKRHNVVVGRNGSGKSNFFYAIQFLLSEDYASLKNDVKLGLMHEGTGARVQTARVLVVFDNTDRRIVTNDSDEVTVSRAIGYKKDQYFIDGKTQARADVVNLMESAGFSRSNPYYIVKQGKINELATAPDAYRLNLLKEVAGTKVYDERKAESEKILAETKDKREKVDSLIQYIDDRLKTLQKEREDLKEYQKWDKMKRSLEHTIYETDINDAKRRLDDLAAEREDVNKQQTAQTRELTVAREEGNEHAARKRRLDQELKKLREEKLSLCDEKDKLAKRATELHLKITDLDEDCTRNRASKQEAAVKLRQLNTEIDERRAELARLRPELEDLTRQEADLAAEIAMARDKHATLIGKQGDRNRFNTNAERREHFNKQLKAVKTKIGDAKARIAQLQQEVEKHEDDLNEEANKLRVMELDREAASDNMEHNSKQLTEKRKQEQTLVAKLRELDLQERSIQDSIVNNDAERQALLQQQRHMGPRPHVTGMMNLRELIKELSKDPNNAQLVDGFYGFILDHLEADNTYFTAIEAAAGNRIYNAIVDTDRTATALMKAFNEKKLGGEINFIPINRMNNQNMPVIEDNDARLMMDCLQCGEHVKPAFEFIFGKIAIIRQLEVGVRVAKQYGVNCVTLEGDQVERRGAMTGGYRDTRTSKLEAKMALRALEQRVAEYRNNLHINDQERQKQQKAIVKLKNDIMELEDNMRKNRSDHVGKEDEKRSLQRQIQDLQLQIDIKKREIVREEGHVKVLENEQAIYSEEVNREMGQMSSQDDITSNQLQKDIDDFIRRKGEVGSQRREAEKLKNRLETKINTNLLKQKEECEAIVNDISSREAGLELTSEREEQMVVQSQISEITQKIGRIDERLAECDQENEDLVRVIEVSAENQRMIEDSLSGLAKQADLIVQKQCSLQTQKEESSKKSRELGTLPTGALQQFNNLTRSALDRKLAECARELKKYENVNKKAIDQYISAEQQKQELEQRLAEQIKNERSINDLIDVLDSRKYDAIKLTFKQVTKNFQAIFNDLVPSGDGQLMWKTADKSQSEESQRIDEQQELTRNEIDNYSGIGIKVSFGGQEGTREMQQLSGGQKSLVALALIFAIQKCDPAPFYLFDEIDAALDAQHRKAVADMINKMSTQAQFITTTFRRELLEHAEMCYGVIFRNKVSHIKIIDKSEAYDFVEDDATHG